MPPPDPPSRKEYDESAAMEKLFFCRDADPDEILIEGVIDTGLNDPDTINVEVNATTTVIRVNSDAVILERPEKDLIK